ncbi:hypothetical protein PN497_13950 [Sphaerospermopsis kisseleviana CS-549]|uniref:Uncharacterized protein n=1 Tax=Sphaerospermopsis kisseleviana CS-549 TaxID=3021783 RepID=A0ABT4ZSR0_9CYAN|nr:MULTISPECIES: hypothetical protein [Sphaerospermopsis]MBD2146231.1 hypothetical protein [Sphaerospermopsis sp. FACHB-1194]MDB9442456.1 hypothetical protein [Sphaerospermopsis kisseleviana CS-549]
MTVGNREMGRWGKINTPVPSPQSPVTSHQFPVYIFMYFPIILLSNLKLAAPIQI